VDRELKSSLDRIAAGIEHLAEDPVIHVESGPPVCPFCEVKNPRISTRESEARGPLGEYIIQCHCEHCGEMFYGLPVMWHCVQTIEEVREEIEARVEMMK
jgi:hypothetical protein